MLAEQLKTLALPAVHLVLAALVTVHALRAKRDPRSAVAWIGLAWLSPVIGSVLYLLLGINRVRTRARSLRGRESVGAEMPAIAPTGDVFSAIEQAGGQITRRHVLAGNSVQVLHNGDAAYPAMLAAIEAARRSVGLSCYLFRRDAIGLQFIGALDRARQRGVQVRVLVDGVGSGYVRSQAFWEMRRRGMRVARFLHSFAPWWMPFINLRNHRKLLVIDGELAFTGGLNIGQENVRDARPGSRVLDKHFRVEGPVVTQLGEAFAEDWRFTAGESLAGTHWFPQQQTRGTVRARVVTSGPNQDLEKIELLILEAVGCARKSVRVMTPYFLPDERLSTALSLASLRGAQVDIVLPERSNHPWIDWACRAHVEPLLQARCRIWTHPPPFDHSKLLVVDGRWCLIGSANWDTRSFTLNFEINVELYDEPIAREIDALVCAGRSTPITVETLARRPALVRLRDSAARLLAPYL